MRTSVFPGGTLPLVVEPGDRSVDALVEALPSYTDALRTHGALLLRGFAVDDAPAFERVARTIAPDLQDNYLGTSPRNALTPYVFTASELPPHYPIPQHAEMTFLPRPPKRLFFCALAPNTGPGGETPLCDLRRVYKDVPEELRERWITKGIRIVRNYTGPETTKKDPRQLKRWDEMFGTTDRARVDAVCAEHAMTPEWRADGRLRITSTQPAVRVHPETGEPTWYNHAHVFHGSAGPQEFRRIAGRMGFGWRRWQAAATALRWWEGLRQPAEDGAMHVTFADGTEIPDADFEVVRDAYWKNMVFPKWERGDVYVIDNASVAHGRMPYSGDRLVVVSWA
jgi:alpha-ketoglutarate-dependent taurine dioxygenase